MPQLLSDRLRVLAAEAQRDEQTMASLVSTATRIVEAEADADVSDNELMMAAYSMASGILAIAGRESQKLRAVKL